MVGFSAWKPSMIAWRSSSWSAPAVKLKYSIVTGSVLTGAGVADAAAAAAVDEGATAAGAGVQPARSASAATAVIRPVADFRRRDVIVKCTDGILSGGSVLAWTEDRSASDVLP